MDEDEFVNNILNDRVENKLSSSKEILELNGRGERLATIFAKHKKSWGQNDLNE